MALTFASQGFSRINPNPKISEGMPVFTSSDSAAYLVDNIYKVKAWDVTNNSWIAIQLK